METLVESVTQTHTLDKDERSGVSGFSGLDPVQTGSVEVGGLEKKDGVFMVESRLFDTEVSVKEIGENGVGDVSVVQVSLTEGEVKMTEKEGRRKSLRKQSEHLKENGVEKSNEVVPANGENRDNGSKVVGGKGEEDGEGGELGDEEHDFSVGDVVWGKIKSHPWWPGQIYNSSDASEAAAKYKRKNRLLVAYFGDGTFAWCSPSQLKPFHEEFNQLAKQSNSKSFLQAVDEAVSEIGRRVDLEVACSCLAVEHRPVNPLVVFNAGIKEGVAVPDTGMGELSITRCEPEEFLARLKYIAQVVSIDNMLDLLVLQHRLSAFYRAKGYKQLREYHEPMQIAVLDDTAENRLTNRENVEDLNGSPVEADWLSSTDPGVGSTGITINRRGPGISEEKLLQSKKRRSMAELMAGNDENVGDFLAEVGSMPRTTTVGPKRRREIMGSDIGHDSSVAEGLDSSRKQTRASRTRKKINDTKVGNDDDRTEHGNVSGKTTCTPRKRSTNKGFEDGDNDVVAEEKNIEDSEVGNTKEVTEKLPVSEKQTIGARTRKRIQESKVENDNDVGKELTLSGKQGAGSSDSKHGSSSKTPKMEKRTGPSVTGEKKASNVENDDFGTSGKRVFPFKMPKMTILTGPSVTGEDKAWDVENDDLGTNETNKSGGALRERKKSKYLSPPYTNLSPRQRLVISIDGSRKETPSISREGESITRPQIVKCGKPFDTEPPKKSNPEFITSPLNSNKGDKKTALEEGNASAHEMLSDFRSAALDLLYPRKQSDDTIKLFFSKFRGSLSQSGSDFARGSRKRVSFETKPDSPAHQGESEKKKRIEKEDEIVRSPKSNSKANGDISGAALTLTFTPGISLPSKDELVKKFSCFGALKESETKVMEDSGCAWIVYTRKSDAENVYHNFEKLTSFGSSVVSTRLRYLSAISKASENVENSHQHHDSIPSPKKVESTSHSQVGDEPSLLLVRQNLEMASSMLEKSWDKLASDVKANLGGEIQGLLNKVSTMVDSSS